MEVKIFYDSMDYNSGTVVVDDKQHRAIEYSYDTDIRELLINIFNEMNIDVTETAFKQEEEE